jgi:two-component system sensor histidine kinase KdpD
LKVKLDWCDINELINSPVNRLKDELANHTVKIEIEPGFPIIKLDFGLIEQAMINILNNAAIYTPQNSTISIKAAFKENYTIIIISDEGKGFRPDEIENVFTKFYRTSDTKTGGTGLGLSIAKGFVEAHHGTIKVENVLPAGAKFTLQIPTEALLLNDNFDIANLSNTKNSNEPEN